MAPDNVKERLQHAYQSFLDSVEEFYDKEKEDIGEAVAHARERLHEIEDLTAEEAEEVTRHFIENMTDIGEQMGELREGVRDAIRLDTMYITTGILERLIKVDIPRDLATAAAHGDLRENAEYQAAKEKQARLMANIRRPW